MKPFSESCEQNKQPILSVLKQFFIKKSRALEIGSGTGQHAVFFAREFPNITWLTSDQAEYHSGIKMWLEESALKNVEGPFLLDVNQTSWPIKKVDAVFSANTVHIMDWPSVENMFTGIGEILEQEGVFCLYGPFNYNGQFSSDSNARFDLWLKQRDPLSGVRDFEALEKLANKVNLSLVDDVEMPANNRMLVWKKLVEDAIDPD